jgi:predicted Fe-Mo cluster-binding NifX family protein
MRIAVATENGEEISRHFGRSPFFAVFDIEDNKIVGQTMRQNTFSQHFRGGQDHGHHGEGHHGSGDPHSHRSLIEGLSDCTVVISHGMGRSAWEDLRAAGKDMIVTDETKVKDALDRYLAGTLVNRVDKLH